MTARPSGRAPRAATIVIGAIVAAASPACTRRTPVAHVVRIENFTFQPATVAAAVGDTIVWTNTDIVPHSATARDGAWDSKLIASGGGTFRLVVRSTGRQAYYCVAHPNMQGTIDVR
jgi:plastocyanin